MHTPEWYCWVTREEMKPLPGRPCCKQTNKQTNPFSLMQLKEWGARGVRGRWREGSERPWKKAATSSERSRNGGGIAVEKWKRQCEVKERQ